MPPRMLELMQQSAVPANVMRTAARGALVLPAREMLEILVYLTTNPLFAEQARLTLAAFDEQECLAAAGDPQTPASVLEYLSLPQNLRPRLLPVLLENPSLPVVALLELACRAHGEVITAMLASARVRASGGILRALAENPEVQSDQAEDLRQLLAGGPSAPSDLDILGVEGKSQYEIDHADEIAAEEGKPFRLFGDILDLGFGDTEDGAAPAEVEVAEALKSCAGRQHSDPEVEKRLTTLQKIATLSVKERIQLAMKGDREARFILVRDGAKVVSSAVLESPKITESEVEMFASMKNVQENVLRGIALKRRFIKMYPVMRGLCGNPRTPIDVTLPLLNHLLIGDLKSLSMNRNISDTISKLASKLFRQRSNANARRD
jgi:hypothetical protein